MGEPGAEVGVPGGFESVVSWLANLGWVGIAIICIWAFATDRLYTRGQVERMLASKEEVISVWRESEARGKEALQAILQELQPIASGNEAVLRAMERIQEFQAEERIRRMRREDRETS